MFFESLKSFRLRARLRRRCAKENGAFDVNDSDVLEKIAIAEKCHQGVWRFEGERGLPKDKAEAKHWLAKAVDGCCSANHSSDAQKWHLLKRRSKIFRKSTV